jgi:hypothetical protein
MQGIADLRKWLAALAAGAALLLPSAPAQAADEIEITDARLAGTEDGVVLSADFAFELKPRLVEIVNNGIPIYFVVEFELTRPRWYWFDEKAAARRIQLRLSYHPLSRHYRLSTGVLQQNYGSLEEALNVLRRVRNWQVLERGASLADASYEAALRMRLDLTLLPKPFQLSAITSREFNLESSWRRFSFRPPPPAPAPVESRELRERESEAK